MIKSLFFLAFLFLTQVVSAQTLSPIGTWTNEAGEAKFEIYKCQDNKLCGKITWLKEPNRDGKPKLDINNEDPKLRSRPVAGLVIMQGFKYDEDNEWEDGTIYDPKNGKTYSCNLNMKSKDKIEVRGYIGVSLMGRSQIWTRVN
jgi:uncharacterized protein (DUF2147 family)